MWYTGENDCPLCMQDLQPVFVTVERYRVMREWQHNIDQRNHTPQSHTAFREYHEINVTGGITFFWGTLSPENASCSVEVVSGRLSKVTNLSVKARFAQSQSSGGLDSHSVQIHWKIHEGFVNILDRYLFWMPQDVVIFSIWVQILVMWLKSSLFLREKYLLVCDLTWIQ